MKSAVRFVIIIVLSSLIVGCAQKPVKSIENLKAAYDGESTASAKYAAFAEKAMAEGLDTVSVMFRATSKSEAIHAANHKKALEKLGEKIEGPKIGTFEILTTAENLADAVKGETWEIDVMYPGFIESAQKEKCNDAVKSFTWAVDTERKHQAFYKSSIEALNGGGERTLPLQWFVCPVCGNTYNGPLVVTACDFCLTSIEKFEKF